MSASRVRSWLTAGFGLVVLVAFVYGAVMVTQGAPGGTIPPGGGSGAGEAGGTGSGGSAAGESYSDLALAPSATELPGRLVIYFLDVGQGDAAYIRTPDGKVVVIDAGDDPDTVPDFLKRKAVSRVDTLVLTHPHADHIGGVLRILEEFEVGRLLDAGYLSTSPYYLDVLEKARDLQAAGALTYREPRAGDRIAVGAEVSLLTLWPPAGEGAAGGGQGEAGGNAGAAPGGDANAWSLAFRLEYGTFSVLFEADIGMAQERDILSQGLDVGATVLKVAHHGSAGSSLEEFLAAVSPRVAVIEVGENDYGHPSPAAVARLAATGASLYTTLENGTIIVWTDGSEWHLATER